MDVLDQLRQHLGTLTNVATATFLDNDRERREHRFLMDLIEKTSVTYECTECRHRVTTYEEGYFRIDTLSFDPCPGKRDNA